MKHLYILFVSIFLTHSLIGSETSAKTTKRATKRKKTMTLQEFLNSPEQKLTQVTPTINNPVPSIADIQKKQGGGITNQPKHKRKPRFKKSKKSIGQVLAEREAAEREAAERRNLEKCVNTLMKFSYLQNK